MTYFSDTRVQPKEGVEKKARKNGREKEKEERGRNFTQRAVISIPLYGPQKKRHRIFFKTSRNSAKFQLQQIQWFNKCF